MRKLLIIVMAVCLLLSMSACGKASPIAASAEEFENVLGSYIDLELYTKGEGLDEGDCVYELTIENLFIYNGDLDYTISFPKGGTLELANLDESLEENGWQVSENADTVMLAMDFDVPYTNAQKQVIYVSHYEPIATYTNGSVQISIKIFEQEDPYDTYRRLVKAKSAPDFLINGEINKDASLQEVVDVMGVPYQLSYNQPDYTMPVPTVEVFYGSYGTTGFLGSLGFTFHAETGEMLEIRYSCIK